MHSTQAGMILLALALGLAGCSRSNLFTAPSAPSAVPPSPPVTSPPAFPGLSFLPDTTLSGMVYETGADSSRLGIEGVSVYCEACGESTHNYAYTDSKGEYVFPRGVWTDGCSSCPVGIWVSKDGYQDPPGTPKSTPPNPSGPGWRQVVIHGDTRFDIELVRR
jgi:hypothetical protein